jgi:predicted deacetylase
MLLVSIHDVTPAYVAGVTRLWGVCADRGITPALLVVPNWHGEWPLEAFPQFVDWLRTRAAEGAEIVLHGDRHDEVGLPRSRADALRAWGKTDGEGEFLTLDAAAAAERIGRGLRRLRQVGLDPRGFVPPAWLAREVTYKAVGAAGLGFSEDDRSIRLLPSGKRLRSPVTRWSTRTPVRAWGSAGVAIARYQLQRRERLPRIALHPPDLDHPATARSVATTLDKWLMLHSAGHYADLHARVAPA